MSIKNISAAALLIFFPSAHYELSCVLIRLIMTMRPLYGIYLDENTTT